MRLAGLVQDSIVDGCGLRAAVFAQGCPHGCPGCHNPQTHDFSGGTEWTLEQITEKLSANPLLDGITLTGGEPMCQADACAALAEWARSRGMNVWVYTGYTYEELLQEGNPERLRLLAAADVLVDGPFVLAKRSLSLPWRGSTNQRVIDINASRQQGEIVLWQPPQW